jgi:hypothetical protein
MPTYADVYADTCWRMAVLSPDAVHWMDVEASHAGAAASTLVLQNAGAAASTLVLQLDGR